MSEVSSTRLADYNYAGSAPTWDHSIILPPIIRACESAPPDGCILDIGCGNGSLLAHIRQLGPWRLYGVEGSESAVSQARSQGLDVRLGDATASLNAMFEPHSFDLILSVEVIEHVYDPLSLLRQARTLLRPEGRIILTTPYHGYLKNLLVAAAGKCDSHYNPLWHGGHVKFWSRRTLSKALEEAGYENIQFFGAGRLPFLWKSMVLSAQPATRLPSHIDSSLVVS